MDENNLFLKNIEEKYERFLDYYTIMNSDFLTMEQQSILSGFLRTHRREGVFFYGGFAEAERRQVVFLPDYTGVAEKVCELPPNENEKENDFANCRILMEYFDQNPENCPICLLDVVIPPAEHKTLGHRDYLGALMGEGIKREKVGDILVHEKGAQIIVAAELADYLAENFRQVGSVSVLVKKVSISALNCAEIRTISLKFTVSSPRIDIIVSSVFGISRKDAVSVISHGKVFVSGREINKPDFALKGGEKIVLRGKGKAIYNGVTGTSKKGKLYIDVEKYI